MNKKPGIDEYIKASANTRRCKICTEYPQVDEDIRKFIAMRDSGDTHLPMFSTSGPSLLTYLKEAHGVRCATDTLRAHIRHMTL